MNSTDFEQIAKLEPDFLKFGLKSNPFSIYPLFADLNDEESCKKENRDWRR